MDVGGNALWRRERDSNPRYGFPQTRFPSVRLQPLGHPSGQGAHYIRMRPSGKRSRPPPRELTEGTIAADIHYAHITGAAGAGHFGRRGTGPNTGRDAEGGVARMLGFLPRFVGLWFVAGALVALTIDAAKSIAASSIAMTPLGMALYTLAPATLMSAQAFVQQSIDPYIGGWLWDPVIQWILLLPTFAVLGVLGFLLTYLGRRRGLRVAYA